MGGLNERTIRQLRETGISTPQRVYEALAGQMHTTVEGAKNLIKSHRVGMEQSVNLMLGLVQTRIDKGDPLGTFSIERSAGNLDDQLKNLKESWESLFEGIDTAPIARAVSELAKSFDPATESGAHMRDMLQDGFGKITHAIDYAREHMETWIGVADRALHIAEKLLAIPIFLGKVAWKAGEVATAAATGDLQSGRTEKNDKQIADDKAAIDRMNAQIEALQKETSAKVESNTELEAAMRKSGIDAGSGLIKGLSDSLQEGKVPDIIHSYVVAEVDRALDAHSPSRVMMRRGVWAGQGLNLGFEDTMRKSTWSMPNMGAMPMSAPSGGGSFGGGGSLKVDVSGHIEVGGSVSGNPQEIANVSAQLEQIVNRSIQRAFESLGHQN
jgi:soluble cytochrome b562